MVLPQHLTKHCVRKRSLATRDGVAAEMLTDHPGALPRHTLKPLSHRRFPRHCAREERPCDRGGMERHSGVLPAEPQRQLVKRTQPRNYNGSAKEEAYILSTCNPTPRSQNLNSSTPIQSKMMSIQPDQKFKQIIMLIEKYSTEPWLRAIVSTEKW